MRPYDVLVREIAEERHFEIRYRRMSVEDLGTPTVEHMQGVLQHIDGEIEEGRPVYVHCWGGIGRTGTVVGCWIRTHDGCTGDEAIDRIAELRRDTPDGGRTSPETSEQRAFVADWSAEPTSPRLSFRERCDALLKFEAMFDGREPFATRPPLQENNGVWVVPFCSLSPRASEFIGAIYDAGWCVPFDWGAWRDEAYRYVEDPAVLADADVSVITKLLTAHVRADRFTDEHLADMAERGHLKAILGRIRVLRDESQEA